MAKLKHNYKFRNIEKRSGTSNMSAMVLKGSIHRVMAQSSREAEIYLKTMRLAENTVISRTADNDNNIRHEDLRNNIDSYLKENNMQVVAGIDIKNSVMSCLSFKSNDDPLATGIYEDSNGNLVSTKLFNIKFNIKKFIGSIVGFGATSVSLIRGDLCGAIFAGIGAVLSLVESTTIKLDENCGSILLIIYRDSSRHNGISRSALITKALRNGNVSENEINNAIEKLIKYKCIKVNKDSSLVLCESIYISNTNNMSYA